MPCRVTAILLTLAVLSVTGALSLNCYVCNSLVDKDCNTKSPPKEYLVNCSVGRTVGPDFVSIPDAKVCWKQTQDIDGFSIVDKTCGLAVDGNSNTCYDRVGTKKIKVNYCVCTGNECNSAVRLGGVADDRLRWAGLMAVAGLALAASRLGL